jgi:hypothetical protein
MGGGRPFETFLQIFRRSAFLARISATDYYNVGPPYAETVGLTNNLFERCNLSFTHGASGASSYTNNITVYMYNNLCRNGTVSWTYYGGTLNPYWQVRDNLFDKPSLTYTYDQGGSGKVQASNNGFISGTSNPLGGSGNKTGLLADYQTGSLGFYYYPTNGGNLSQLINTGSRYATNATLYHFTTTTDQLKEASTMLDIGFHWIALDATGLPCDGDGDGLFDYWEDFNGDGVYGAGDPFNWLSSDSDGDGMVDHVGQISVNRPAPQNPVP